MESDTSKFNVKDWLVVRENVKRDMVTYLYEILEHGMNPFNKYELRLLVWYLESNGYTPHMMNEYSDKPYSVFYFMDKNRDNSPWKVDVKYDSTLIFEGVTFTFKLMGRMLFKQRFAINEDNTLKLYH